jgi:hypothetical protein
MVKGTFLIFLKIEKREKFSFDFSLEFYT